MTRVSALHRTFVVVASLDIVFSLECCFTTCSRAHATCSRRSTSNEKLPAATPPLRKPRFLSALTFSNLTMPTFVLPQVAQLSKNGRLDDSGTRFCRACFGYWQWQWQGLQKLFAALTGISLLQKASSFEKQWSSSLSASPPAAGLLLGDCPLPQQQGASSIWAEIGDLSGVCAGPLCSCASAAP